MKTIFLAFIALLLFTANLSAQKTFEGKITFKMTYEGAMAAQMETMAPSGMVYQVKGSDTRFQMQGGMAASMLGTVLVKSSEKSMYMVKDSEKKAYKMPLEKETETTKPVVTKEDEVIEILGYKCQKYKVETKAQGQEITQYVWAAKDINIVKTEGGQAAGGNLQIDGVEGFPLRTKAVANVMGMEIITNTEATEVSTKKLKSSDFTIPKGYKIEETTMKEYMGKMTGGGF